MEYITTKDASAKWGITPTRITILANEGRIPGAYRLGKSWLIPANASKPVPRKSGRKNSDGPAPDNFSFPLYHFRPDWSDEKKAQLTPQQQNLLLAESAILECRFLDAYPLLKPILKAPDDIVTEIGCLWSAGICCICLNKSEDFTKIYLRLQMLLSNGFPHREDLVIILDFLKTYVETLEFYSKGYVYNPDIHHQALPLSCMLIGFSELSRETLKPGSANVTMLELNLRFLNTIGAVLAAGFMHYYLLGIYFLRQDMEKVKKHVNSAVQITYENRCYFPLVTFYRYYAEVFSPVLDRYPEEFQDNCYKRISQYEENFPAFLSSVNEYTVFAKLTDADIPYARAVLMGVPYTQIARELGISPYTAKRRLVKICEKLGVNSRDELLEYLHNYM